MKKTYKIFIVAFIFTLIVISLSYVQAVDMFLSNLNLSNNETAQNIIENESDENIIEDELSQNKISNDNENIQNENNDNSVSYTPTITKSSNGSSNGAITTSDIIDIILISVCIVLIFLAIAILIRCK